MNAPEAAVEVQEVTSRIRRGRDRQRRRRSAPGAACRPVPGSGALLAGVQQPGPRPGQGSAPGPRAGAGEVPGDLRQQPRRVLHGPGRRAEATHRGRRRGPHRQRPDASGGARRDPRPNAGTHGGAGARLRGGGPTRAGLARRRAAALARAHRPGEGPHAGALRRADLPRAHPPGGRPVAPVPLHLRPVDQSRRAGPQPGDRSSPVRAGQGAHRPPPLPAAGRGPVRAAWRTSSRVTWTACSAACRSFSTTPSGSPATRTSRSRRTTPRTSCSPWRRNCCDARWVARPFGWRSRTTSTPRCSSC